MCKIEALLVVSDILGIVQGWSGGAFSIWPDFTLFFWISWSWGDLSGLLVSFRLPGAAKDSFLRKMSLVLEEGGQGRFVFWFVLANQSNLLVWEFDLTETPCFSNDYDTASSTITTLCCQEATHWQWVKQALANVGVCPWWHWVVQWPFKMQSLGLSKAHLADSWPGDGNMFLLMTRFVMLSWHH